MTGGGVNLTPGITNPSIERELTGAAEKPQSNPDQEDEDNGVAQAPSAGGVSVSSEDLLRMESLKQTYDSILNKVFADNGPITAPNTAWPDPWISNGRPLLTVEQAEAKVNFQQERERTRRQRMADQVLRTKKSIVFENFEKSAQTTYEPSHGYIALGQKIGLSVAQLSERRRLSTILKHGYLTITLRQEIHNLLADYYPNEETDTWTDAIRMEKLISLGFKKLRGKVTFNIAANLPNDPNPQTEASVSHTINWELNLEANSPQKVLFLVFDDGSVHKKVRYWNFGTAGLESDKPSKITFDYRDGAIVVTDFIDELAAWIFGIISAQIYTFTFGTTLSVSSLSR